MHDCFARYLLFPVSALEDEAFKAVLLGFFLTVPTLPPLLIAAMGLVRGIGAIPAGGAVEGAAAGSPCPPDDCLSMATR